MATIYDYNKNSAYLPDSGSYTADGLGHDGDNRVKVVNSAGDTGSTSGGYSNLSGGGGAGYLPAGSSGSGGSVSGGGYIPGANSQAAYLNDMYDAQQQAALAALESAYKQNVITLDAASAKVPGLYQDARNRTSADAQVASRNFNEYAAASGLNTGAGSQAQLAMNNVLQGNMSALSQAESNALAEIETERLRVKTAYQSDIAQAIAAGNLARAQALYQEAVRIDESMIYAALQNAQLQYSYDTFNYQKGQDASNTDYNRALYTAETLAAYGDFSGYLALGYTQQQVDAMAAQWAAEQAAKTTYSGGTAGPAKPAGGEPSEYAVWLKGVLSRATSTPQAIGGTLTNELNSGKITAAEADAILNALGL